jgi:hypothetical protein
MGILRRESTWDKVSKPIRKASATNALRSGLTAGATVLALSAVSAAASAVRRRQEGAG